MPNLGQFCMVCHGFSIPNGKTDADPVRIGDGNLRSINWGINGDYHGKKAGSPVEDPTCTPPAYGSLRPPYDDPDANYVLSCTDCHEPHGSRNVFLHRRVVNGKDLSDYAPIEELSTMDSEGFYEFCDACHEINFSCGPHWGDFYNFGCAYCHDHHGAF